MKVGIFYPNNNLEHLTMLHAFADGLRYMQIDFELIPVEEYKEVDIAVVFGIGKKNVPVSYARGAVIAQQKLRGKKVIVIEKGYIERDEYYAVGFDNLNGRADFKNHLMKPDRFDQLGIPLKSWKQDETGVILLCGQVPSDASVQYIDINEWCRNMYAHIKSHTDRPVRYRPHPLTGNNGIAALGDMVLSTGHYKDALQTAFAVVTFSSNMGVDAIMEGVPAYSFDIGSMIHEISNKDITTIDNPDKPDRTQWASDIAYTQWTQFELEMGLPWVHLMRGEE